MDGGRCSVGPGVETIWGVEYARGMGEAREGNGIASGSSEGEGGGITRTLLLASSSSSSSSESEEEPLKWNVALEEEGEGRRGAGDVVVMGIGAS